MLLQSVLLSLISQVAAPIDLGAHPEVRSSMVAEGQGHFPVIDLAPDGRAVVVLRGGGGHLGIGGRLDLFFSNDGLLWYGKRTAVDTSADDRNPAFGITPEGRFLLGFHHQSSYTGDGIYEPSFDLARDIQVYSDDEGRTWSEFQNLKLGTVETTSPYGRIIRLSDGSYIQNVYGAHAPDVPGITNPTDDVEDYAYLARSTNEGVSWGDVSLIAAGHNETSLLALDSGTLLAAARDAHHGAHLDIYSSVDQGRSWRHVAKATDKRQHPADLIDLGHDTILLIFGNRRDKERDIQGILSRDSGKTWDTSNQLRLTTPVSGDFGYPSAVVMGEDLLIVHYWAGSPHSYLREFESAVSRDLDSYQVNFGRSAVVGRRIME